MKTSRRGIDLLVGWEGCRLRAYDDVGGKKTIGVGHLLRPEELRTGRIHIGDADVPWEHGLTREQATELLAQDVEPCERAVSGAVAIPLEENQFDALVAYTFNVGVGAFLHSGVLRAVNGHRLDLVPSELRKWVHVKGVRVPGLVNRREGEIALWEGRI